MGLPLKPYGCEASFLPHSHAYVKTYLADNVKTILPSSFFQLLLAEYFQQFLNAFVSLLFSDLVKIKKTKTKEEHQNNNKKQK